MVVALLVTLSALGGPRILADLEPASPTFGRVSVVELPSFDPDRLDLEPAGWRRLLSVRVAPDLPALVGSWTTADGVLHFAPRYPPSPGLELLVRFDGGRFDELMGRPGRGTTTVERRIELPSAPPPTTTVAFLEPTGPLPANALRIYLTFSAPMRRQDVLGAVRLEDERGRPVEEAFVEVPGGLWDPTRTRLTLLFHPGRIKRGVGPHEALGPPLRPGHRYRLMVAEALEDAAGAPLVGPWSRWIEVGSDDRRSPDPERWSLSAPAHPTDPLTVTLPEPADPTLLRRLVGILGPRGEPLPGRITAAPDGTVWRFAPHGPWVAGPHTLVVAAELEDISGNRIDRPFEVETATATTPPSPRLRTFVVEGTGP